MRTLCFLLILLLSGLSVHTNESLSISLNAENKLFVITLDGFRWQEVFNGADSALLMQSAYNANPAATKSRYWHSSAEERRRKLMPFFWNLIAHEGELYGNRAYNNKMNVANPYALSYPGYNELLTGRVDLSIFGNGKVPNRNLSVLDFLAATETYRGKVAAFASWDAFPFILNTAESNIYFNGSNNETKNNYHDTIEKCNGVQRAIEDEKNGCADEATFAACKQYVQKQKPSVVFLSFSGTDEAAHNKQYDRYLQQATDADRMIGELWQYLQTIPDYTGKTTFLLTTDHGRGSDEQWYTHGVFVNGSSQTWMALLGKSIPANGEKRSNTQLYQKNLKSLMLHILENR